MKMNKTFLLLSWVMISLLAYWFGWKQGMNQNFPEISSGLSQGIDAKQAVQGVWSKPRQTKEANQIRPIPESKFLKTQK